MDNVVAKDKVIVEAYRLNKNLREMYRMCIKGGIFWYRFDFIINLSIIILGFLASKEGIISKNSETAGILAFAAGIIKTFASSLSPAKKAEECKNAANAYGSLEDKVRIFRTIDIDNMNSEQAIRTLSDMTDKKNNLGKALSSVTYRNVAQFNYDAVNDLDGDDYLESDDNK